MFVVFEREFSLELRLSHSYERYLKIRYSGFVYDFYDGDISHLISFGEKLTDEAYETIRPPVAKGKKIFLFDTNGDTLSSNFLDSKKEVTNIFISKNFNMGFLCNFIEYLYYLHIKKHKKTIIHCSAFYLNDKKIICPAGRNTGKTNILIQSLANGASYLADDWLICGQDGEVEIFPKAINIQTYNIPKLREQKIINRTFDVYNWLEKLTLSTDYFSEEIKSN